MTRFARYWISKPLAFGLLLAALTLRALIPSGYMPAEGESFGLQLCRAGLPAAVQAAHSSQEAAQSGAATQSAADASLCVFGVGSAAAPAPQQHALQAPVLAAFESISGDANAPVAQSRRHSLRQPRAPPTVS